MDLRLFGLGVAALIVGLAVVWKVSKPRSILGQFIGALGYSMILAGSFFAARELW